MEPDQIYRKDTILISKRVEHCNDKGQEPLETLLSHERVLPVVTKVILVAR